MIALILAYFIIVLLFSFLKTQAFTHPFFDIFKSLFPSWRFFDESTDTPVLLYRFLDENEWKIAVPIPKRRWYHVLWNPEGNFYLAYHSHMQQLMGDLSAFDEEKLSAFHHHISYKITANFVKALKLTRPYQFKVSAIKKISQYKNNDFEILEDILLSPEITP